MDTTVETPSPSSERRKNKKKKKTPSIDEDDFVIPDSALKPVTIPVVTKDIPLADNSDALTVKVPKKKQKKDKNKRPDEVSNKAIG